MKDSRPKNQKIEFEQEREEIAKIAMMLTDGEKLYYLLGVARALLRIETKENQTVS